MTYAKSAAVTTFVDGALQAVAIAQFEMTTRKNFYTDADLDADQLALVTAMVNRWHNATPESIAASLAAEGSP